MDSFVDIMKGFRLHSLRDLLGVPVKHIEQVISWISTRLNSGEAFSSSTTSLIAYLIVFVGVAALYKYLFCKTKPTIICAPTTNNSHILKKCDLLHTEYHLPLWGTLGFMQTMYVSAVRRAKMPNYKRECLESPDGEHIVLDWQHSPQHNSSTHIENIVVIVPGICNNSESHYVRHFSTLCVSKGFTPVVFHMRGTSASQIKTPRLFTWGDTADLNFTLEHLHKVYPQSKLFLIGFSLGGNVVVQYCGQYGAKLLESNICGAISVCQGYDALKSVRNMNNSPFWNFGLTTKLKRLLARHSDAFKDIIDVPHVLKTMRTIEDFDTLFTCKIYGYESVVAYYNEHSSVNNLHNVKVPLLLLNAVDDPIVPPFLLQFQPLQRPPLSQFALMYLIELLG